MPGFNSPPNFWTMLLLAPDNWSNSDIMGRSLYEEDDPLLQSKDDSLLEAMLYVVVYAIDELCDKRYDRLLGYFKSVISAKSALFDPDYHDSLLSDNANFSRSKSYFWAINTLREIEESISQNIKQIQGCMESWPQRYMNGAELHVQNDYAHSRLSPCIDKLETVKRSFGEVRDEAVALRDGVRSSSYDCHCIKRIRILLTSLSSLPPVASWKAEHLRGWART